MVLRVFSSPPVIEFWVWGQEIRKGVQFWTCGCEIRSLTIPSIFIFLHNFCPIIHLHHFRVSVLHQKACALDCRRDGSRVGNWIDGSETWDGDDVGAEYTTITWSIFGFDTNWCKHVEDQPQTGIDQRETFQRCRGTIKLSPQRHTQRGPHPKDNQTNAQFYWNKTNCNETLVILIYRFG